MGVEGKQDSSAIQELSHVVLKQATPAKVALKSSKMTKGALLASMSSNSSQAMLINNT